MPNRVLREGILDSDRVNKLSWSGEVFYRRLMSIVDDFGRYDGRVDLLRTRLFPLRTDKVSIADIDKWLTECVGADLVSRYTVNQKPYLELLDFNQTVRIKKSKFPAPQMQADEIRRVSGTNPIQTESESETSTEDRTHANRKHSRTKVEELFARTVENDIWIEQTAMHCRKEKEEVRVFAENYIKEFALSGKTEKYGPESIIGFLIKDLQKEVKNGNNHKNPQDRKIGRIDAGKLQEFIDGK